VTSLRVISVSDRAQPVRVPPTMAQALLVYGALRVVSLATTAFLLRHGRFQGLHANLWGWLAYGYDAGWYHRLETKWYASPPGVIPPYSWFPGYPAVIDAVAWVTRIGVAPASLLVTFAAGFAAAAGLARLGQRLTGDDRVAILLVALWSVAPSSYVLSMAYSEALFCALAVWALIAVAEERWLIAAGLTGLAGLVRNSAIALIAAVAVAGIVAAITRRTLRPALAVLIAPIGLAGYQLFVATRVPGGLMGTERVQHMAFDWGKSLLRAMVRAAMEGSATFITLTLIVIATALILTAWLLTERLPAYLIVYTLGVVALAVMTNTSYLGSKPRFLLPAFLLALPFAKVLAPVRKQVLIPLITILGIASTWFGLFLVINHWAP